MSASLLESVQGLLTRTYVVSAPLQDIGRYVIGDAGLKLLYDGRRQVVRSASGEGARLLVRDEDGDLRACIYYPDAMIRTLEAHPPQAGIHDRNVDAFAVLVEELDHLLVTADRAHAGRPVTFLELELHANVSKYLVLARFLAGRTGRLGDGARVWLRHELFEKGVFSDGDAEIRRRYRDAARFSIRFIEGLEGLARAARVDALRRFHRAPLDRALAIGSA